jgi:hypothetical protein
MPFKSEKQRRWMWANDPEMAKKWEEEDDDSKNEDDEIMKIERKTLNRIIQEELFGEAADPSTGEMADSNDWTWASLSSEEKIEKLVQFAISDAATQEDLDDLETRFGQEMDELHPDRHVPTLTQSDLDAAMATIRDDVSKMEPPALEPVDWDSTIDAALDVDAEPDLSLTKESLSRIIREELELLAEIRWSGVGDDYRDGIGGMRIAKYPGPWASGDDMIILEDDPSEGDEIDEQDSVGGFMAPLGRGSAKQREKRRMSTARAVARAFGGATLEST